MNRNVRFAILSIVMLVAVLVTSVMAYNKPVEVAKAQSNWTEPTMPEPNGSCKSNPSECKVFYQKETCNLAYHKNDYSGNGWKEYNLDAFISAGCWSARPIVVTPVIETTIVVVTATPEATQTQTPPDHGTETQTPPDNGTETQTPPDDGTETQTPPDDGTGTQTPPDQKKKEVDSWNNDDITEHGYKHFNAEPCPLEEEVGCDYCELLKLQLEEAKKQTIEDQNQTALISQQNTKIDESNRLASEQNTKIDESNRLASERNELDKQLLAVSPEASATSKAQANLGNVALDLIMIGFLALLLGMAIGFGFMYMSNLRNKYLMAIATANAAQPESVKAQSVVIENNTSAEK